jgi:pilus assembly protein CpaE
MVGFLMSAASEYSVMDAVANVDRLDVSFWEGMVAHGSGDLDVLRSPSHAVAALRAEQLRPVLAMVRKLYRWVVVDLGRPSEFSVGLLDRVSELLLVTTTSVPALFQANRTVAALRKVGFTDERLRMIVNQTSRTQEFSGNELDQLFGLPVYAKLPGAGQELHDACVQKTLLGKKSDFRMQVATLARRVAGLPPEKARSRVAQMFSFAEKAPAGDSHTI